MRFTMLLLIISITLVLSQQNRKDTCPNLQKFTYDEWDAKLMCPNPNAPILEAANLPKQKCSRYNPNKSSSDKKLNAQDILELKEKMKQKQGNTFKFNHDEQYQEYKRKQQKKEDL